MTVIGLCYTPVPITCLERLDTDLKKYLLSLSGNPALHPKGDDALVPHVGLSIAAAMAFLASKRYLIFSGFPSLIDLIVL